MRDTTDRTSPSTCDQPSPLMARALIRSLNRGTAIAEGLKYIHVGHEAWLAAQDELLAEVAEDTHSDTKFVRGVYGAGKSHFLAMVQASARTREWATSHIECKVDGVQIDRFETLYPRITQKLLAADIPTVVRDSSDAPVDSMRFVLEKWARAQAGLVGIRDDGLTRPFDADARLYSRLEAGLLRSNLPPDFIRATIAFARAFLAADFQTMSRACAWMGGANERVELPLRYVLRPMSSDRSNGSMALRPIGKGTARDAMRGLLWLLRAAGYTGLVLCIDEVEELAKLGSRRRQDQALQALREYVDHAGGEGGFRNLCMYLAATPEMFEGENYFPRYDALATRIQPLGPRINWRGPVIDLDRTPLDAAQMRELAGRICKIHHIAYGRSDNTDLSQELVSNLVVGVLEARYRVARPRLLARVFVDALERARQERQAPRPSDIGDIVARAAGQIAKEAAG